MSRVSEKLLELLREPQWTSFPSVTLEKVNVTEEMSIIPDTEHGPMLEIASKNEYGTVVHKRRLNLAAVDDEIGKLIRMRDLMAPMRKEKQPDKTDDIS